jgi:hypothetical protein
MQANKNNTAEGTAPRTIVVTNAGKDHRVTLLPTGTIVHDENEEAITHPLDIEMLIDGKQYGIGQPLAADFRNGDGSLSDEGLRDAALEVIIDIIGEPESTPPRNLPMPPDTAAKKLALKVRLAELEGQRDMLLAALRQAGRDLIDIKTDCDTGEFEIDPQFAIDRVQAALTAVEARR